MCDGKKLNSINNFNGERRKQDKGMEDIKERRKKSA
jgi:hypothetical protein